MTGPNIRVLYSEVYCRAIWWDVLHSFQDNLFEWEVELSDFPPESLLAKDLIRYGSRAGRKPVVTMKMVFPRDYPMNPPFVRIVRPRFKFLTGQSAIICHMTVTWCVGPVMCRSCDHWRKYLYADADKVRMVSLQWHRGIDLELNTILEDLKEDKPPY